VKRSPIRRSGDESRFLEMLQDSLRQGPDGPLCLTRRARYEQESPRGGAISHFRFEKDTFRYLRGMRMKSLALYQ
jgi:hypothetical protein